MSRRVVIRLNFKEQKMKFYIPFALKDGEHSIYDVITSIVAAEGVAPTAACVFNGIETPRSSPALFTGLHPLNPFKERLLAYDRLPILNGEGDYAAAYETTAYICVDSDTLKSPVGGELKKIGGVFQGVSVYETSQALFFSDPSRVSLLFVSPKMYENCKGCRAGVNTKNEKDFGYALLSPVDMSGAIILHDEEVSQLAKADLFRPISEGLYEPSWRMEALQGAALCCKLVRGGAGASAGIPKDSGEAEWNRIVEFTNWLGNIPYVKEPWAGRDQLFEILKKLKALPSFVRKSVSLEYFRTDDFVSYELLQRKLIEHFVDIAVSLKMTRWNWADDECRASLAEAVMDRCIVPVMREQYSSSEADRMIEKMSVLMMMVERRFREPNTYEEFDEDRLESPFVRALYRFLASEGRLDRIQEYLADARLSVKIREMIAAMYGAFKGYAQVSVKRLVVVSDDVEIESRRQGAPSREEPKEFKRNGTSGASTLAHKKSGAKKWIHRGAKNKQVPSEELESYLADGWKSGRAKKSELKATAVSETQTEFKLS